MAGVNGLLKTALARKGGFSAVGNSWAKHRSTCMKDEKK